MYFIIMRHLLKGILDQNCIIIKIVNLAIFIALFILKIDVKRIFNNNLFTYFYLYLFNCIAKNKPIIKITAIKLVNPIQPEISQTKPLLLPKILEPK